MNEVEQQSEVKIFGPGHILKQAREGANLTSQDIANKIKLKKSIIEDIEQDNYDINLSLTFVKGYLKLYAKHVDVDESEVMLAFENLNTQNKEPAKLQSFSRRFANQANDDKLMLVTYLIVAVVIALVVIWWWQQSSNETNQVTEIDSYTSEMETDSLTPVQDDTSRLPSSLPNTEQTSSDSLSAGQDNASVVSPASQTFNISDVQNENIEQVDTPEQQAEAFDVQAEALDVQSEAPDMQGDAITSTSDQAAPVELVFEFSGDCWMNLSDATGENIAYGVKVKGRVMPITGIPPFEVTLGAPEVVQIRYAGEALDMSFLTPGRIAKFELPLSE